MNPRDYFAGKFQKALDSPERLSLSGESGQVLQLSPPSAPRPGILVDGAFLAPPRRPSVEELRLGMDTRTLTGRRPNKHTFILAERRAGMPPLFWRIVQWLQADSLFFPLERIPVFIRCCDLGLDEARAMQHVDRLGYRQLRHVLWQRTWLHPETPIWWQHRTRWRDDAGFCFELGGPTAWQ